MEDRIKRLMDKYSCDSETAQRYSDMLEEGYPAYQAKIMAGLADPPDDSPSCSPRPVSAPAGKYDEVLLPFLTLMQRELHANAGKGDRPGWMAVSLEQLMLEIYYHAAKLQKALRDNASYNVGEHAADVANLSMMVADRYGLLDSVRASHLDAQAWGLQILAKAEREAKSRRDSRDLAFEAVRKRFCALPRHSFIIGSTGGVKRVEDRSGAWIEFHAAHALFDPVAVDAAVALQAEKGGGDAQG